MDSPPSVSAGSTYYITLSHTSDLVLYWTRSATDLYSNGEAYSNGVPVSNADHGFKVFVDLELAQNVEYRSQGTSPAHWFSNEQIACEVAANVGAVQYPTAMIRVSNDGALTSIGHVPFAYSVCISGTPAEADALYTPGISTPLMIGSGLSLAVGQSFTALQSGELVRMDMQVT